MSNIPQMLTRNEAIQGIIAYYNSLQSTLERTAWMNAEELTQLYYDNASEWYARYMQLGVSNDVSINGKILGWQSTELVPGVATSSAPIDDSNIIYADFGGGNTVRASLPGNFERSTTPGSENDIKPSSGVTSSATGDIIPTIADRVRLATMGVNIGAKIGMAIDESLYNLAPDWWNEHLPSINPETWGDLCGKSSTGDYFMRTLFGIDNNTGGVTGYINQEALAYYYEAMRDNGFFPDESNGYVTEVPDTFPQSIKDILPMYVTKNKLPNTFILYQENNTTHATRIIERRVGVDSARDYHISILTESADYYNVKTINCNATDKGVGGPSFTYDNKTVYNINFNSQNIWKTESGWTLLSAPQPKDFAVNYADPGNNNMACWAAVYEDVPMPGHEGVTTLPNSTQYPPTAITGTTPQEVLQQLQNTYPDLFQNSVVQKTILPDGSIREDVYVPVPWVTPGIDAQTATTTQGKTQTDYNIDDQTFNDILFKSNTDDINTPPDTGIGNTPAIVDPTGNASSLWAVYNPSQSQLDNFGAWLWSSNFVDQLKKLFNDPMQAILGIHKVFVTPSTGGSSTIKCGYLDSGVSANVVDSQYTSINCGTVNLNEYFGNVFDYSPYTKVSIFLPFIGIVPLDPSLVMRSKITVKYTVDVITGACIAKITVKRDGNGGILYTYGGSAIVSYPISSGSYMGVVTSALTTALGVGAGLATGGMALPAFAGMALHGLAGAKTQVQHSGQFSGSVGAMGGKKPYLIVVRPQTKMADDVGHYLGLPSNNLIIVRECSGYTRFKDVHLHINGAYNDELIEIENYMKNGIII